MNNLPGMGDFISDWERDASPAEREYDKDSDTSREAFSDRAAAYAPRARAEGWSAEFYVIACHRGEEAARKVMAARQGGAA